MRGHEVSLTAGGEQDAATLFKVLQQESQLAELEITGAKILFNTGRCNPNDALLKLSAQVPEVAFRAAITMPKAGRVWNIRYSGGEAAVIDTHDEF